MHTAYLLIGIDTHQNPPAVVCADIFSETALELAQMPGRYQWAEITNVTLSTYHEAHEYLRSFVRRPDFKLTWVADLLDKTGRTSSLPRVHASERFAHLPLPGEVPVKPLHDVLGALNNLLSDITMLEDPAEIDKVLNAIREGDGEGVMVASNGTTVVKMPIYERLFRNHLCYLLEAEISTKARNDYKAWKVTLQNP